MANGKVTLTRLSDKLDNILEVLTLHVSDDKAQFTEFRALLVGMDDRPGLKGRLDRLEQVESNRRWHIRSLWGAFIASGIGLIFKLLGY